VALAEGTAKRCWSLSARPSLNVRKVIGRTPEGERWAWPALHLKQLLSCHQQCHCQRLAGGLQATASQNMQPATDWHAAHASSMSQKYHVDTSARLRQAAGCGSPAEQGMCAQCFLQHQGALTLIPFQQQDLNPRHDNHLQTTNNCCALSEERLRAPPASLRATCLSVQAA
jgi:hypothetical protein